MATNYLLSWDFRLSLTYCHIIKKKNSCPVSWKWEGCLTWAVKVAHVMSEIFHIWVYPYCNTYCNGWITWPLVIIRGLEWCWKSKSIFTSIGSFRLGLLYKGLLQTGLATLGCSDAMPCTACVFDILLWGHLFYSIAQAPLNITNTFEPMLHIFFVVEGTELAVILLQYCFGILRGCS